MNRIERKRAATNVISRETALVHRLSALLLEYPSPSLLQLLPYVKEALEDLPPSRRNPLALTVSHLASKPLEELEVAYVDTFDLKRRCSLYLSYFAYGDTRKRGVALVQFKQAYNAAGMKAGDHELPDFLPVVLEFAATTDAQAGIELLLAHRAGLEVLRRSLIEMDSPWRGPLIAVCDTLPALRGNEADAVEKLIIDGPPDEEVGLEPFAADPLSVPTAGARR